MRIALAGNPNSGKTSVFNALTGAAEKVGNWAGVTVEKKERPLRARFAPKGVDVTLVDLPGAYSMSPFTSEESITSAFVRQARLDVIINVVDATNLSRSLFFTTQLLELGIPVVVALNKSDLNRKQRSTIDTAALSSRLGCAVIETVGTRRRGLDELLCAAIGAVGHAQAAPFRQRAVPPSNRAAVEAEDRRRFALADAIVAEVQTRSDRTGEATAQDRVDELLTNRWLGFPIFAAVMLLVFWISQAGPAVWLADLLVSPLEAGQEALRELIGSESLWASLLTDGILGGFIAIVGFLPLVMVMYFLIALLEDCGYMARASVVLDPIFKRVGLSGKSIIPFIIGTGCAIPGVMACRTIRDERERRTTAMLAPFMPCGAKLPVIALFAGAFFRGGAWVGALMYFLSIAIIFLGALLVRLLNGDRRRRSFFIIELPDYKLPSLGKALAETCRRGRAYVVKAGSVLLVCNFAVHVMQTFTPRLTPVAEGAAHTSLLATVASPFALLLAPIVGRAAWQLAAAAVTGFIAKENVVGTLAVTFAMSDLFHLDELTMNEGAADSVAGVLGLSSVGALAFLMFNLFTPPCFAAIGAMRAEIADRRWFLAALGLQFAVGYDLAFLVFFFGTLLTGGSFGAAWMPIVGWAITLLSVAVLTVLILRKQRAVRREEAV